HRSRSEPLTRTSTTTRSRRSLRTSWRTPGRARPRLDSSWRMRCAPSRSRTRFGDHWSRRERPSMSTDANLIVRHAHLITMDDERRILPDGAGVVRDGVIVDIGPDAEVAARWAASTEIDAGGAPVHPGLVEAHLHCSYQLFRGALPDQ